MRRSSRRHSECECWERLIQTYIDPCKNILSIHINTIVPALPTTTIPKTWKISLSILMSYKFEAIHKIWASDVLLYHNMLTGFNFLLKQARERERGRGTGRGRVRNSEKSVAFWLSFLKVIPICICSLRPMYNSREYAHPLPEYRAQYWYLSPGSCWQALQWMLVLVAGYHEQMSVGHQNCKAGLYCMRQKEREGETKIKESYAASKENSVK